VIDSNSLLPTGCVLEEEPPRPLMIHGVNLPYRSRRY